MKLAKPRVVSQPSLLWRGCSGTLDSKKILTQYHTAFQFLGTGIRTGRKVNCRTIFPESSPIFSSLLFGLYCSCSLRRGSFRCESTSKSQCIFFGSKHKVIFILFAKESFTFPANRNIISGSIQRALQHNLLPILTNNSGRMSIISIPLTGIITMSACRIRKTEVHSRMCSRTNNGCQHICFGVTNRLYFNGSPI